MATTESPEQLFRHTSGRWLYNEKKRLAERERIFNIAGLKRLAAEAVSRDVGDVVHFDKLGEGAANRAFIIGMRDGLAVVARIPYTITKPRHLLVASEAATMTLLHSKGLPVPKVYGYSATSDNAAGVEYILMEYSPGQKLSSGWFDATSEQRRKFVKSLVDLESRMGAIPFPASGSLFFRRDLPAGSSGIAIEPELVDSPDSLVVGPSVSLPLWFGRRNDLLVDRGPFREAKHLLECGARKEIKYLRRYGRPLLPFDRIRRETFNLERQSPETHVDSLKKYLQIAEYLLPREDDSLMSPTLEQLTILRDRELHYEYVTRTAAKNPAHFNALRYPYSTGRRKVFQLSSDPWEGDNIPLRSSLIFVKKHWKDFSNDLDVPCPITFSEAEEEECLRLDDSEREASEQLRETKEMLGIGPEGWVPNDHYAAAKEAVVKMKQLALEQAETEMDRIAVREHWVFDDMDEDEYL
ncbi:hypothetical protein BST61_g7902 [Cercospora zeina]